MHAFHLISGIFSPWNYPLRRNARQRWQQWGSRIRSAQNWDLSSACRCWRWKRRPPSRYSWYCQIYSWTDLWSVQQHVLHVWSLRCVIKNGRRATLHLNNRYLILLANIRSSRNYNVCSKGSKKLAPILFSSSWAHSSRSLPDRRSEGRPWQRASQPLQMSLRHAQGSLLTRSFFSYQACIFKAAILRSSKRQYYDSYIMMPWKHVNIRSARCWNQQRFASSGPAKRVHRRTTEKSHSYNLWKQPLPSSFFYTRNRFIQGGLVAENAEACSSAPHPGWRGDGRHWAASREHSRTGTSLSSALACAANLLGARLHSTPDSTTAPGALTTVARPCCILNWCGWTTKLYAHYLLGIPAPTVTTRSRTCSLSLLYTFSSSLYSQIMQTRTQSSSKDASPSIPVSIELVCNDALLQFAVAMVSWSTPLPISNTMPCL